MGSRTCCLDWSLPAITIDTRPHLWYFTYGDNERRRKMVEICCECDEPTGRAGKDEDSFYSEDTGNGPYCEQCFNELEEQSEYRMIGRPH